MTSPLRCHLLIGPPASGKTTLAHALAPLLSGPGEPPAVVLSTDRLRTELFGDAAVQGPWGDIEALLHQRIRESVAGGVPVIVDATHARRPWRLAITQALELPAPVEWIGWWLTTPLATCLAWNQTRERQVPESVIQQMDAALWDASFKPSRAEGLAAVVAVKPMPVEELEGHLRGELNRLEGRIRAGRNRESRFALHGYSRLLDLERLLYLLRLLSTYPDLSADDPATRAELEKQVFPLPEGELPERAAVFLSRLHGPCYGDASAIAADLEWLHAQGFCSAQPVRGPLEPPPPAATPQPGMSGGFPPLGDAPVFQRVFALLRHLLQQPFDRAAGTPLQEHLIAELESIPGSYFPGEAATLRKDIERLLTPYGFRSRHHNVRHGYSLGTALLSAPRLREVHGVVREAVARLADPTAQDLLEELEQRLQWGGIAIDATPPVRAFANRSIVSSALVRAD
ncbi:MAG: ATP-binding protein, partial [Cyanobacteriota bacterium]|nr:ATP-binding protein [Cyanobacteriota bacterium]